MVSDHVQRLQTVYDKRFARVRCDDCAHEYLLAFSCKCWYCCPSCHAKRLSAYCLYRRRLIGEIARVAARTLTVAIRTRTGERELAVGIVACLQTHGPRGGQTGARPHLDRAHTALRVVTRRSAPRHTSRLRLNFLP